MLQRDGRLDTFSVHVLFRFEQFIFLILFLLFRANVSRMGLVLWNTKNGTHHTKNGTQHPTKKFESF